MPNGSDYSIEEFRSIQRELEPLDRLLEEFSQRVGGRVIANYHGAPYRQVRWGAGVTRSVHIHVSNREELLLGLTAIASADPPEHRLGQPRMPRRIKSETLEQDLTGEELLARLPQLLQRAREIVESWTEVDLK